LFKHSAFKEESEVRMILEKTHDSKIGFRSGTHTIIPFGEISLNVGDHKVTPSVIFIKTSKETKLAIAGIEEFLIRHNISSDIVYSSSIPYRETI